MALHVGEQGQIAARAEHRLGLAVAHFERNPFIRLGPRFLAAVGGAPRADALHEEFLADRRARGLPVMPESIKLRTQRKFEELAAEAFRDLDQLPPWKLGVSDASSPVPNFLLHIGVHDSALALAVTLIFLLCAGIALENIWGPAIFGGFAAAATLCGAALYAGLHADLGTPWHGGSGLVAAMLGAYFVQAVRWPARLIGGIPLPSWLLFSAWALLEYVLIRGVFLDLRSEPVAAHAACVGFGVLFALVVRRLGVEEGLRERDERKAELLSSPVLDEAMAAHGKGRSAEALELLRPELERRSGDRDVALGFWAAAVGAGRAEEAIPVLLGVIRDDLRKRRSADATRYWIDLVQSGCRFSAEPTLLVRMGEALLDEGHPDQAVRALLRALDGDPPLASALALRAVRVARDLDPGLTRRAAQAALADGQLDPERRDELRALSSELSADSLEEAVPAPAPVPTRAVAPKRAVISELVSPAPDLSGSEAPAPDGDSGPDPHALSPMALTEEAQGEAAPPSDEELARWNDPGLVEDLSAQLPDESVEFDAGARDGAFDPAGLDLAAESDELPTEPLDDDPETTAPMQESEVSPEEDQETTEVDELPPLPPPQSDPPAESPEPSPIDLATARARPLKLLQGVPIDVEEDGLQLEIDGKGKTRIPFERIEALGVAAVEGLGPKPVLIVDLILNWVSLADEPLKVIRLPSDRFDPSRLLPDAPSSIDALRNLLETILEASGATPLPDADGARGRPFAPFASLALYHDQVLMVGRTES
ncbi:MAG: rhomboid family intramembrane serine protease [Proteobacteria bacterium]|nr:rhomboid family intramembrane serine protease [Pseudomonadota bacterium]